MKITVYSDLHIEFGLPLLSKFDADLIILAGDIGVGPKCARFIKETFKDVPVIYVLGNHEYYGQLFPSYVDELKGFMNNENFHVLENESIVIADIEFFGCSLWTDFQLFNEPSICMKHSKSIMSDYLVIRSSSRKRRLIPVETVTWHIQSVRWLRKALLSSTARKKVVITHHAPLIDCVNPIFHGDLLSSAFASNLEQFILKTNPDYWIFGHTHFNCDFVKSGTRFLSNQAGYPGENLLGYNPNHSITI